MIRTQISLREEQMRALKAEARQRRSSIAEVIRAAVDRELGASQRRVKLERALEVIGGYRSGRHDVGLNHDQYLFDDELDEPEGREGRNRSDPA